MAKNTLRFFNINTMGDADNPDLCMLDNFVKGIETNSWRIFRGARLKDIYPDNARIYMDKEHRGIELSDLIGNTESMLIVNKRLKDLIHKHCGDEDVEYLPFDLYDHRKRLYSRDYFIINPIGTFDCLDLQASTLFRHPKNPDKILKVEKIVLDRKKMKGAPQLFRIDNDPTSYVLNFPLAKELSHMEPSNIIWAELPFTEDV